MPPLAHVHVWLIETGGDSPMFDTGFPTPEGEALLEQKIRPLLTDGRRLEAAFISHYHPDRLQSAPPTRNPAASAVTASVLRQPQHQV